MFQAGDEVFGCVFNIGLGAFAEYICVPENVIVPKPANLSFPSAAAVPVAALTALQGLRNTGDLQPGQKVLINGASGGVGSFAVQIAKSFGAEVTAVCSTRNLEMVRSIGADHAIDYTAEDFNQNGQQYDLLLDAVGNRSVADYERALSPKGICVIIGFTSMSLVLQHILRGAWVSRNGGKKIGLMKTVHMEKDDLLFLSELLETGKVVPVIDRCYPLDETAAAVRYLEEGHARGKVVITMEDSNII